MLRKTLAVLALSSLACHAQAQSIVFDIPTLTMTLPSVTIGATNYRMVLHYDTDGKLSITSATPLTPTSSESECSLTYSDSSGSMKLTFGSVSRKDPLFVKLSAEDPNLFPSNIPELQPKTYLKLIGKVVSGSPHFCAIGISGVESGRQYFQNEINFKSDTYGADAGYPSCGTFQPGTQTVLYLDVPAYQTKHPAFNPLNPLSLTYTPAGADSPTVSCTLVR